MSKSSVQVIDENVLSELRKTKVDDVIDLEKYKNSHINECNDDELLHEKQFDGLENKSIEPEELTENEINTNRIHSIQELSNEMTIDELKQIMLELKTKRRESQIEKFFVPKITENDFAGILLMEKVNDPNYYHSLSSGVDVWRKKVDGSTWNGVGRTIIKNISPREMCELYWNYDVRRTWDTFYTVIADLEILPNGNKISRTATWVPKPFKQRDFIHTRDVIRTDDCCIGVYLPAEHVLAPVGMNGFIRGLVNFSGFVFRKQGNDCLCTLMTQTDINVALPDMVINKFVAIAVRWYVKLMKKAAETNKEKVKH
ncbi:hypothetical protein QTN25_000647 [Entamoeba marina]